VHIAESRINALLGADYPFEAPGVDLPSSIRKKATKVKKAKAKTARVKPRRLTGGEVAYRITWETKGQTTDQTTTELKQIDALLEEPLPGMKLLKIDTLDLSGQSIETLFEITT
jgi:hypothetical protein